VLKTAYRQIYEQLKSTSDKSRQEIADAATDRAIKATLKHLLDVVLPTLAQPWGDQWYRQIWIDSNWMTGVVVNLVKEYAQKAEWSDERFANNSILQAIVGCGASQFDAPGYSRPAKNTRMKKLVGPDSYVERDTFWKLWRPHINVNVTKSWIHERWAAPVYGESNELQPGALSIFVPTDGDHLEWFRQQTAEKVVVKFVKGKGEIRQWVQERSANHWLDCLAYAGAAARSKYCDHVDVSVMPASVAQDTWYGAPDSAGSAGGNTSWFAKKGRR
jgi:hypothetical protein